MRKMISKSALVSGLLAMPLLAHAKADGVLADSRVVAEMQAHLAAVTGGAPMEAERMQALQRRMVENVREQIARAAGGGAFFVADGEDVRPMIPAEAVTLFEPSNGPPQQMEKAAFIGVATVEVPGMLHNQLKLPRGMGLVVQFLVKDSPAALAGVRSNDVLEKLDDQLLVNGQQFAVLVRAKKPGDSVALTVIRGGERTVVTVILGEKEMPVLEDSGELRQSIDWQGKLQSPATFQPPQGQQGLVAVPIDGGPGWQRGVRKTVVTSASGTVTRTLIDGENEITLTTAADGKSELVIKDKNNKEQYRGDYTTEENRAKVPGQYVAELKDLLSSSSHVTIENLQDKSGTLRADVVKWMRLMRIIRSRCRLMGMESRRW